MSTTDHSFFILGNPRSGTTMLRLMLNSHPDIVVPPECGFIEWWYEKYKGWSIQDSKSNARSFINDLKRSRKIETWGLDYELIERKIKEERPVNYARLCALVYRAYAEGRGRNITLWGDKNNYYIDRLDVLYELYPRANYILIVRDGRDVACSYRNIKKVKSESKYVPKLPEDIRAIAKEWVENNEKVLNFFSGAKRRQLHILRYEDLLRNTAKELKKMCAFLSVPYHSDMENYHLKNKDLKEEPQEFLEWKKKTVEKPDASNIGKFKKELTEEDVRQFEDLASGLLDRFDYQITETR